jgi:anaerobic ribonucleoside-triphosphate reductase activating protein
MQLYVGGFICSSVADGMGIRSVLFLQGCSRKCDDCHNVNLQPKMASNCYEVCDVIDYIMQMCLNKRITISGGEPLEQPEALVQLITRLRKLDYDICVYTGYNYDEVPIDILKFCNYVKVGKYEKDNPTDKAFVGSDNQVMYKVFNKGGKICCQET